MTLVHQLALGTLVVAALPVLALGLRRPRSRVGGALDLALWGAVFAIAYLAGAWLFLSHYLKFAFLAAFLIAALLFLLRIAGGPAPPPGAVGRALAALRTAALLPAAALLLLIVRGRSYPDEPVALDFPLRGGTYAVMQGGSNRWINPFHAANPSERYALDLVKLNAYGNRANGLAPAELEAYAIFGERVHSPCSGVVTQMRDGLPDRRVGHPDVQNSAGNYVIIECLGVRVLLAHLKRGSVTARAGQRVQAGGPVGAVGNSGNTIEPHLHLSASARSTPGSEPHAVPMLLDGRVLTLNSVVTVDGGGRGGEGFPRDPEAPAARLPLQAAGRAH